MEGQVRMMRETNDTLHVGAGVTARRWPGTSVCMALPEPLLVVGHWSNLPTVG